MKTEAPKYFGTEFQRRVIAVDVLSHGRRASRPDVAAPSYVAHPGRGRECTQPHPAHEGVTA